MQSNLFTFIFTFLISFSTFIGIRAQTNDSSTIEITETRISTIIAYFTSTTETLTSSWVSVGSNTTISGVSTLTTNSVYTTEIPTTTPTITVFESSTSTASTSTSKAAAPSFGLGPGIGGVMGAAAAFAAIL
ncbi:hypothetical protein EG329_002027 [Mollisiaceae sp. DMI_Dod_QoI]|nr:hypothetical protein EG329_002027 [Helotiales sp. DMI_Dod_QoI]